MRTPLFKVVINRENEGLLLSKRARNWLNQRGVDTTGHDEVSWGCSRSVLPRHNKELIACIEELGAEANGKINNTVANLIVVEIPYPIYRLLPPTYTDMVNGNFGEKIEWMESQDWVIIN